MYVAPVRLVVAHRVAMEERAAAAVLPREANLVAFLEQRRVGERLGEAPVHHQLARRHLATVIDDLLHLAMQREAFGERRDPGRKVLQQRRLHARADLLEPVDVVVPGPVDGVLVADQAEHVLRLRRAFVEAATVLLDQRFGIARGDHARRPPACRHRAAAWSASLRIVAYMTGCVAAGSSASLWPSRR